jgi:hypothetical protein
MPNMTRLPFNIKVSPYMGAPRFRCSADQLLPYFRLVCSHLVLCRQTVQPPDAPAGLEKLHAPFLCSEIASGGWGRARELIMEAGLIADKLRSRLRIQHFPVLKVRQRLYAQA